VVIRNSVILGNDFYESADEIATAAARGMPTLGIGEGTIVENAIVDKNVRIGRRVRVVNDHGWESTPDSDLFTIRDAIAVVPKEAVLPDGWVPEPGLAKASD
jgi:glucose-1-phosphate adenylyltransferase